MYVGLHRLPHSLYMDICIYMLNTLQVYASRGRPPCNADLLLYLYKTSVAHTLGQHSHPSTSVEEKIIHGISIQGDIFCDIYSSHLKDGW